MYKYCIKPSNISISAYLYTYSQYTIILYTYSLYSLYIYRFTLISVYSIHVLRQLYKAYTGIRAFVRLK